MYILQITAWWLAVLGDFSLLRGLNRFKIFSSMQLQQYQVPEAELVMLYLRQNVLDLSNFGNPGQAGDGFGDDTIIDITTDF